MAISSFGQSTIKEAAVIPMFSLSYAYQIPQQDLAKRFGDNSNVEGAFTIKGKKGWVFGVDASYLFGSDVKEEGLMEGLLTSNGNVINQYGEYATIAVSERGFYAGAKVGKVINVTKKYPNSGIYITGSVGLLQHHIHIENESNNAPQIIDDYVKGYDRLTNGLAIKGFVGYMHLGKKQLANFFGGIEYTISNTQSRRDFNFDMKIADTQKRNDNLFGIRVGWIIPLYRRVPDEYFTY